MSSPSSTPSTNRILVLGAGELGSAILTSLALHPRHTSNPSQTPVSVLLRPATISTTNPTKRAEVEYLTSLGVTLIPGDIANDSTSTLASTFKSFTTIIGCTGMVASPNTQLKLLEAVLAAEVKRYIPWQFGVDYDVIGPKGGGGMFSEQLDVRAKLRGQNKTEWKIVSTGMFMSFVFERMFGVVVQNQKEGEGDNGRDDGSDWRVNALGSWENQVTLTDVVDIGRGTAEVVFDWENVPEEIVYLAGDTVNYGKLADAVEEVAGGKVERVEWTVPYLQAESARNPDDPMKKYRVVFAEGRGLAWDKARSFNAKKRLDTMSVTEGVSRYLRR